MLKPQDILVLLKIIALDHSAWTYSKLASDLGMSASEVHAACKRALKAHLARMDQDILVLNIRNILEFIEHGLRFCFYPKRGEITRGIATGYAAEPLNSYIVADSDPIPVWPYVHGEARGMTFEPLYRSAPIAAKKDKKLYELLVLVDSIRSGRARERQLAVQLIREIFEKYEQATKS